MTMAATNRGTTIRHARGGAIPEEARWILTLGQHSRSSRFFLKIAGRRLRAYSIVTHIGRRSGCEYRNPVGAYPLGDGFVIAILSYKGSTSSCGHTAARTPRLRPLAGDTSRGAPRAEEQT